MKKYIFILDLEMGNQWGGEEYKLIDYFIILLESLQRCNFEDTLVVITNKKYSSEYVFPNNTLFIDFPFKIDWMHLKKCKFSAMHLASEELNLTDNDIIFICDARDVYFQDFNFIDMDYIFENKYTWFSRENQFLKDSEHMKNNIIRHKKYNKVWESLEQINEKFFNSGICVTNINHLQIIGKLMKEEWELYDLRHTSDQPILNKIYFLNKTMNFLRFLNEYNDYFVSISGHEGRWELIDGKIYNVIGNNKIYSSVIHQWDRKDDLKEIILNLNK